MKIAANTLSLASALLLLPLTSWASFDCIRNFNPEAEGSANGGRILSPISVAGKTVSLAHGIDPIHDADLLHRIWQETNSYLSRYKPMATADGKPVTDIAAYIAEHRIPKDYQGYYQKTVKGVYEEDIKGIPNQWLAFSNANENTLGARSYVDHLHTMARTPIRGAGDAVALIYSGLGAIHADWYERNLSWTKPYGEPATFAEAKIDQQYTAAMQLFRIAENYGLLKDATWRQAFDQVMTGLSDQRLQPFKGLSVEDTYLGLMAKAGIRPSIEGDLYLAKHFDSKLPHYGTRFPGHGADESAAVLAFLRRNFPTLKGVPADAYGIFAPPVAPGSDARIFLIKDTRPGAKGLVAVLKIQAGAGGLNEVVATAASEKAVPTQESFTPVRTLGYGAAGNDYFILQEGALKFEADKVFTLAPDSRQWMTAKVAQALATIHGEYRFYAEGELKAIGDDLKTFKGNAFYDIRKMREQLQGGRFDAFTANEEQGAVSGMMARWISAAITKYTDRYSEIVQTEPHILSPAKTHGDFHGGNIFLNPATDGSMLIDYSGLTFFMGKKIGTGDRANDVGRMLGNILVEGTRHQLDFQNGILPLLKSLYGEYVDAVGVKTRHNEREALRIATIVYLNRFIAINAADLAGKKFKPASAEDSSLALRKRLFQNWVALWQEISFQGLFER